VVVHVAVVVLVVGFLALGWWQIGRAADGNLLSFGYAVEWPVFAAFVIFVWIVEMRKALRADKSAVADPHAAERPERADQAAEGSAVPTEPVPAKPRRARNMAAYDDADDPALAEYNHYLAWFNANPHATPADYPGMKDSTTTTREN
jgi:DNA-binding transcriptional regulator of glucitol operon